MNCLVTLLIYKVLKRYNKLKGDYDGLVTLLIYKVLKRIYLQLEDVLLSYFTDLQGSQTETIVRLEDIIA